GEEAEFRGTSKPCQPIRASARLHSESTQALAPTSRGSQASSARLQRECNSRFAGCDAPFAVNGRPGGFLEPQQAGRKAAQTTKTAPSHARKATRRRCDSGQIEGASQQYRQCATSACPALSDPTDIVRGETNHQGDVPWNRESRHKKN